MSRILFVEDAMNTLLSVVNNGKNVEEILLMDAFRRVTGEDIYANINQPPFDRSPLDGYAVRHQDIQDANRMIPAVLTVTQTIHAGDVPQKSLQEGDAAVIMTGAPIPPGATCVVRQEVTDGGTDVVRIYQSQHELDNICFAGEDITKGQLLINKGEVLDAVKLGILASQGIHKIKVFQKPRIAVLSTGSELQEIRSELKPGMIYDSNRYTLSFRAMELGMNVVINKQLPDDIIVLTDGIRAAIAESDFLITTGGVSVGMRDYLPVVCNQIGTQMLFEGIAAKPGSPVHAYEQDGTVILCLSGNPFAAYATFELLAVPALRKLSGQNSVIPKRKTGELAEDFNKKSNSRRIIRAYQEDDYIHIPGQHSSGSLASMNGCNCLIDIPAGTGVLKKGQQVEVIVINM